ncbi:MAG: hypothetical protein NE328_20785 [Lentisphaeraceae bacterium]|nr:hypothetical protein [Lentisphaeraceae bacterium]
MKSKFIFAAVLSLICAFSFAQEKKSPMKKEKEEEKKEKLSYNYSGGLSRPYTIYKNPTDGFYYIGSTDGLHDIKDGNAQITVLNFEDFEDYKIKLFKRNVIISSEYPKTSLDAPKGMIADGDLLLVTDFEALSIFKKVEKGLPQQIGRLKIKGAKNLESIIKVDDAYYMTDSGFNGILKVTDLMDPEKREVSVLTRIHSPKGMVYDAAKNALLIVSSKVNVLYEYSLEDPKKSTSYVIGPKVSADMKDGYKGFNGICIGNQKEIYLTHYGLNRIMVYFRDEDRPPTIKKPMKYARDFVKDVRTPTSIIYDATLNRIAFTEFYYNRVIFRKGIPPQLTDAILNKDIETDEVLELDKK